MTRKYHSPGRINLIGEHTDYTGGLVMPAAIDLGIRFVVRPLNEPALHLRAADLNESLTVPLPLVGKTEKTWANYLVGVAYQFQQLGYELPGLDIEFGGNLPAGAGISSSAALEGGMAFLLNDVLDAGLSRPELARLCQRSSNEFLGIPTGIMDQFASLNGTAAGPILLNCDTLEFTPVNAHLPGYVWLLVNSNVTHDLSEGAYHQRVRECAAALATLQTEFPELTRLSAATPEQVNRLKHRMEPTIWQRAHYVTRENERVRAMAKALEDGNADVAGSLLNATHAGLRDDYEVSCPEVDFLQRWATEEFTGRVLGARLMGGGFGGCTLNLVAEGDTEELMAEISPAYREVYGLEATFIPVRIGPGTYRM